MLPSNKPSGSGGREGVVAKGHHGGCRRQLSIACLTPDFRLHIYVNRVRVTTRACRILGSLCVCVFTRARGVFVCLLVRLRVRVRVYVLASVPAFMGACVHVRAREHMHAVWMCTDVFVCL